MIMMEKLEIRINLVDEEDEVNKVDEVDNEVEGKKQHI